jgi:DNA-binding MarR family transcriptional regulator
MRRISYRIWRQYWLLQHYCVGSRMFTRFNSKLPARPESIEAVLKVLSQNDDLMVKDIARLSRLTQSQVRRALEELVASRTVVVRKLQRPRKTLYHMNMED